MRGERVTQSCHNSPHWKWGYGVRVTSRSGSARRILGISKKVKELKLDAGRDGRLSLAHRSQANLHAMGAARDRGQMIKH